MNTINKNPKAKAGARTVVHRDMANAIRALAMDAVERANSGHPGMPMGFADVATVLFTRFLKFDAGAARWPDRDRFVISAGHGSMLLYALAYLTGYEDMDISQIRDFRQLGSRTPGHPEYGRAAIVETTTGPLGQGFANAVGMALSERMLAAEFGDDVVDHYTYVVAGDGCLMEGISHEVASLAGHLGLGKLIVLFDDNHVSIDGPTELTVSDDQAARFAAYGWDVRAADGHDPEAIAAAIEKARKTDAPSMIACRTTIGFGAPTKQGTAATHGAPLGADEVAAARQALGWTAPPFEVPEGILAAWRQAGSRGRAAREDWQARLAAVEARRRDEFTRRIAGDLKKGWEDTLDTFKQGLYAEAPKWATRKASHEALKVLTAALPEMVGGSADLTGSNLTLTEDLKPLARGDFAGRYIYYGVREHAMAGIMNGLAVHGGFVPFGGTFLIFTDYCRNAIRLSALMGLRVIYVMTHDSIGLGEDGPTHQPVEHLAGLRAIPNLCVFRPADAVETAECWALALKQKDRPSILSLSRQGLPAVRLEDGGDDGGKDGGNDGGDDGGKDGGNDGGNDSGKDGGGNLCARGAYVLAAAEGEAPAGKTATLFATGSEVAVALEARDSL